MSKAPAEVKARAAKSVRAASFAVEKRVKVEMPVDTGRARASWGHWTPGDVVKPQDPNGMRSRKTDAHWVARDGGLTVEQGSNVRYIPALNEGHSQQAPAGFIDKAADAGARALTEELKRDVGDLLK